MYFLRFISIIIFMQYLRKNISADIACATRTFYTFDTSKHDTSKINHEKKNMTLIGIIVSFYSIVSSVENFINKLRNMISSRFFVPFIRNPSLKRTSEDLIFII